MLLKYITSEGIQKSVRLKTMPSAPITIGRSIDATVTIEDPKASRVNSAIRYWDDAFIVRDMNSSNGTVLNGNKIEIAIIRDGDTLQIGNTTFKVVAEGTSADITRMER